MKHQRIELVRGPKGRDAPPAIKQALRLARRLRQHRIRHVNFLSILCDSDGVVVEVGRRVVRIDGDGNIRQEMRPQHTSYGWRADPQGLRAHRARAHVLYLTMAASGRSLQAYQSGRIMVGSARFDRMYGSIV